MLTRLKMAEGEKKGYPGPEDVGSVLGKLLGITSHEDLLCTGALREVLREAV